MQNGTPYCRTLSSTHCIFHCLIFLSSQIHVRQKNTPLVQRLPFFLPPRFLASHFIAESKRARRRDGGRVPLWRKIENRRRGQRRRRRRRRREKRAPKYSKGWRGESNGERKEKKNDCGQEFKVGKPYVSGERRGCEGDGEKTLKSFYS